MHPLFQVSVLQGLSGWDPVRTLRSSLWAVVGYSLPHVIKCWCGIIVARFSQVAQRHSHDLCRFSLLDVPSGWRRQLHVACAHLVRVTSTLAVGRVATFARRWLLQLLRCSSTHCGLPPNTDDLLSVRSCCLAFVLPAPRFPSFRPDTASFRSCLSLPPGFLGTREAGICAGSRACFTLLSLLDVSVSVDLLQGHSGSHRANSRVAHNGSPRSILWLMLLHFNEVWFLTIDPFVGVPFFIAKLSKRQYCWRVVEDFHSQEYIQFFDINCGLFMRLHFSIGCHDHRRTARFRQSIHFSRVQVLFADHIHRRTGVDKKSSILRFEI